MLCKRGAGRPTSDPAPLRLPQMERNAAPARFGGAEMGAAGRTARAVDAARRQAAHRPSGGAAVERRAACVVMLNKFGMAAAFKCPRRASAARRRERPCPTPAATRSEEHTSELQS